jgi:protein TonB
MSEPEQSRPNTDGDLVWPPPVSTGDVVWLEPPQAAPAAARKDESQPVPAPTALSLSCFLFPEVLFEWHDAVAVVQQLAEQISDGLRYEPSGSLPDLSDIGIEATGHLLVRLDPRGRETTVRGLGYLLHQLLANRNGPVALRLLVAQTVSEAPTITSVRALSEELARWERPHRLEKLVQLHDRARRFIETRPAAAMPQEAERSPEQVAQPPVTDVPARPAETAWPPFLQKLLQLPWKQAVLVGSVGLGLALLVVAFIAATLFAPAAPTQSHPVTAPAAGLSPEALTSSPTAAGARASSAAPSPAGLKASAAAEAARATRPTPQQSLTHDDISAPSVVRAEPPPSALPSPRQAPLPQPTPQQSVRQAAAVSPPEPDVNEPQRIYKTGDAGLTEAVLIKPYLPETPDPQTPPDRLGTLELVVDAAGNVEFARLRSPFNRYRERWWVYVAKNWKFRPALKDGRPVKSLKRIVITDTRESDPQ